MTKRFVVSVGVFIAVGVIFIFVTRRPVASQQPTSVLSLTPPMATSSVQTALPSVYMNQRLGLSFYMPKGYQLATEYMRFLNATSGYPISNWSATNAESIVITVSSLSQQQQFLSAAEHGSTDVDVNPAARLPGSIYITAVSPTLANVESNLSSLQVCCSRMVSLTNIRHLVVGGAEAIRYTASDPVDGNSEEVIYVDLSKHFRFLSNGTAAGTLLLMSNRSRTYDEIALQEIVESLKFN